MLEYHTDMGEMYFLKAFLVFVFEYINIFNLSLKTSYCDTLENTHVVINVLFF